MLSIKIKSEKNYENKETKPMSHSINPSGFFEKIAEGLGDQLNTTVKIGLGRKKGQLIN